MELTITAERAKTTGVHTESHLNIYTAIEIIAAAEINGKLINFS